jgi:hypothetical protein
MITPIFQHPYLELSEHSLTPTGIMKAQEDYIPIEAFKSTFEEAASVVKERNWKYFIFDKSNLEVFHQPCMEWYYTEWKKSLLQDGLSYHVKILPALDWFRKSVMAGIEEIKGKHTDFNFDAVTVRYADDLSEAIDLVEAKANQYPG